MEYHFKYNLTEDDFAEANVYTSWSAPWQKKNRAIFTIRSFIYFAVGLIVTIIVLDRKRQQNRTINFQKIILAVTLVTIGTGFNCYQEPFGIKNRAKKFLQKEENRHLLDEIELVINDARLSSSDSRNITEYKWESIVKYATTKEYFFLYVSSVHSLIIPKRIFMSQQEIGGFDDFLTQKIPLSSSFRSMGI